MIKILHLFPNLMNLYGEYANLKVLKKHLEDQNLKVSIETKEIQDDILLDSYDFIYMGSGTEKNEQIALKELTKYKDDLYRYIHEGGHLLLTGNAMELLGNHIGDQEGLGYVDFDVELTDKRYTGDVIVKGDEEIGEVVGFINKSSLIHGNYKEKLFTYEFKDNNLVDNDFEGYHFKNVYGTHIIGPILAKNPLFIRSIVKQLLPKNQIYEEIEYPYETDSFNITLQELKKR